ncbi:MAG: hypothetical protein ACFFBD_17445 [Candidatus Hodarchaeota archaeon]
MNITQTDEILIKLLEMDITQPQEEVADTLGITVDELEKRLTKILRARWVVPNVQIEYMALPIIGLEERLLIYSFISGNIKKLDRIIQQLSSGGYNINLIWRLFAGRYDIVARGLSKKSALDEFFSSIERIPGVFSADFSICTGRYKYHGLVMPREERGRINNLTPLDKPEHYRALIDVLREDPLKYGVEPYKVTSTRLEQRFGLRFTPSDIQEQIKTLMERKVIRRIGLRKTRGYWEVRGFKRRIFVWFFTQPLVHERVGTLLSLMENVDDVFDVTGNFDVLAAVWTHSFHQWGNQLEHLLNIEGLSNSESFMAVEGVLSRSFSLTD